MPNLKLLKLDKEDHFGGVRDMDHPEVKYHQNGLNYDYNENLIFDKYAKAAGFTEEHFKRLEAEVVEYSVSTSVEGEVIETEVKTASLTMDSLKPKKQREVVLTKANKPFKTEKAALYNMSRKNLSDDRTWSVKPYKTGWAIIGE